MAGARTSRLYIRLSEAERAALTARAGAAGVGLSEYARQAALTDCATVRLDVDAAELRRIYAEQRRQGANINQIARELNTRHKLTEEGKARLDGLLAGIDKTNDELADLLAALRKGGRK